MASEDEEREQSLVAAEDARAEAAALAAEVDRLTRALRRSQDDLRRARAALDALAAERAREADRHREAVEAARVLAEELQAANEELTASNEALEERVAERTAALAGAVAAKQAALRDRERLIGEVHHQVGNSLQISRSILNLHAGAATDPGVGQQFREAALRMQAIAAVHHRLYGGEGWGAAAAATTGLSALAYLEALLRDLCSPERGGGGGDAPRPALAVEPADLTLRPDRAVALGLVVTELVTNAVKYGGGGAVRVALRRARAEAVEVAVEDDGPGFPPDFDPQRCRGLGMRVVRAYALRPNGVRLDRSAQGGGRVVATLAV